MEINDALPSEVVQVLTRCLRKDPQRRWQTMSDLKVVLQDLKEDSESGKFRAARTETPPLRKRRFLLNAVGSFLIIVVATLLVWLLFFRTKPPAEFQISRLTYDSGLTTTPAISPDGKLFAWPLTEAVRAISTFGFSRCREGNLSGSPTIRRMTGGPRFHPMVPKLFSNPGGTAAEFIL